NYDIERNLRGPLAGLGSPLRVAVRTGDTPQRERQAMLREPPDILITTPESLFLLLTSQARRILGGVETLILDEVHAVAGTKRGAHLALSVERLEALLDKPMQRIGLSATQRPLEEIGRFVSGGRPIRLVDAGTRKELDLQVVVPVDDLRELGSTSSLYHPVQSDGQVTDGSSEGARGSIWPSMYPELLALVEAHRSTIVFVNNRRLAERLALRLNELAEREIARAHHGSLAREQRVLVEEELKAARIPCLVATSSLELGIDMGAVDLVIQVESPGSVARGLQRIGRAGHQVGEPSRGKVFPKFRGDLLEATVVVQRMLQGAIEETRYPRNPLDVVAQQIVAMCAMDEWTVGDLGRVLRRAANFEELSDELLRNVLDLLAGRYPSDEFAELRPRIVWDRRTDTLRGREGAGRLAIASGGTIPDRGLFGVFTVDGRRVGELDEEMVYESRRGEVFMLGASSWRIEDITLDRVVVSPAPGEPGKMPFWHGDKPGRPLELGRAIGAATRELSSSEHDAAVGRLRTEFGLDELAAENLTAYLDDQREATGAVPDDRTIVVERFPDEIGDWRVCVLSPFGERVHAPWAMAIEGRLAERYGLDVQVLWSDDGIAIRLPESEERIPVEDLLFDPDEIEELVVARLPGTALFTTMFREAAARALLLPRRTPGRRTPLWQQRQRGADLLEVASRHPTFPILLEATREVLRDVFDVPGLREVLGDVRARRIHVVPVDTPRSSPFAQSLLFRWVSVYMYEADAPMAERRAAALSLDRELLRELLGAEDLRELIDPVALAELELELQHLAGGRRARNADDVHDLLRRLGHLSTEEVSARSNADPSGWLDDLERDGRAIRMRVAGQDRFVAVEDAGRYRDALGTSLPLGVPGVFTEAMPAPLEGLVARFARTHGPFGTAEVAERFGIGEDRVAGAVGSLEALGRVVRGEFRPGGLEREWCDADVLRSIRRRSLAALRKEVEPVEAPALGRFVPEWQAATSPRHGPTALVDAIAQLQGASIPASIVESEVLRSRVRGYRPADLDALCASGDVVWMGAGGIGADDGGIALGFRETLRLAAPPLPETAPAGAVHDAIRDHLRQRGASFWPELLAAAGVPDERIVLAALWDLVWAGEVTNDTIAPMRAFLIRRPTKAARSGAKPRPGALRRAGPPSAAGRWSLVRTLLEPEPSPTEAAHARAMQLLERHGVLTREAVLAEGAPGGFAGVYAVLRALEESGKVRRGYFVDGLGAAQFALPGAVERIRDLRETSREASVLALAAADPAQPYGAALPWPQGTGQGSGRPSRTAGAYVVLADGEPAVFLERGARTLLTFAAGGDGAWIDALASLVKDGRLRRIELSKIDGEP
ncbi:MAG TPA: helicase-related protein, partial [Actinomycetota bacterium]